MTRAQRTHAKHKARESAYSLVFKVKGENEFGAATGTLTFYYHGRTVHESDVFSGGLRHPERYPQIPNATYRLRLDIRGHLSSVAELDQIPGGYKAHEFYGIEQVDLPLAQTEWGHYRVHLNEPDTHMPQVYRGNFLHGKLRPDDYTHGCICERSEVILKKLWKLPPQIISLKVVR
jgi:hypothetical protein